VFDQNYHGLESLLHVPVS